VLKAIQIPALLLSATMGISAMAEDAAPNAAATVEDQAATATSATPAPPTAPEGATASTEGGPAPEAMPPAPEASAPTQQTPAQEAQTSAATTGAAPAPGQAPTAQEATAPTTEATEPATEATEYYTPPLPPEYERILRQLAEWQAYVKKQHETGQQRAEQRLEQLRKEREEAVQRAVEKQEKLAKYYEAMRRLAEEQKAWIEAHKDEYLKQAEEREKGLLEYHEQMRRMAEERHKELMDKLAHLDQLTRKEVQDLVEQMRRQMQEDALALDSANQTEGTMVGQRPPTIPMRGGVPPYAAGSQMPPAMRGGSWQGVPNMRQPAWAGPQTGYPRTGRPSVSAQPSMPWGAQRPWAGQGPAGQGPGGGWQGRMQQPQMQPMPWMGGRQGGWQGPMQEGPGWQMPGQGTPFYDYPQGPGAPTSPGVPGPMTPQGRVGVPHPRFAMHLPSRSPYQRHATPGPSLRGHGGAMRWWPRYVAWRHLAPRHPAGIGRMLAWNRHHRSWARPLATMQRVAAGHNGPRHAPPRLAAHSGGLPAG